ncbi:MAG: GNAT family N-acetyltransferase [Terriglobales bacterium]
MTFKVLREFPTPEIERAWRDYLARIEAASHYESPEYFIEPLWADRQRFAVLAFERDQVVGVLTGMHAGKNVMSGLPARPQISVDPAFDTAAALETLAEGLLQESASAELVSVYTWDLLKLPSFEKRGFQCQQLQGNVVLDLTLGADALFKQFPKDRRRNIRYAEKNGVVISEITTDQDIADAYAVHSAWRGTSRKVVHARKKTFEAYEKIAKLKGNRLLLMARVDGKAVAINSFRFYPGGLFESSANSSLDEFIHLKPNDLLQWKGIEWACNHGLRRHSLGGSHPFLLRFGGTVIPILRYRLDRTFLHRHDLSDTVQGVGRRIVRNLPPFMEDSIRKLAGKRKK